MSISKFFNVGFFREMWEIMQQNGGFMRSAYVLYRENTIKSGTLVGTDSMGNQYFESNKEIMGSNRWVRFAPQTGVDYEGSMIPVEWYGWMHHKSDVPPTVEGSHVQHAWIDTQHPGNLNATGTSAQYVPYSTTKPKVEAWVPPKRA